MSDFISEAFKELRDLEGSEKVEQIEVEELIKQTTGKTKIFRFGNVDIEIRLAIPKALKKLLIEIDKGSEGLSPEELSELEDYFSYKFLSQMCVKPPYTTEVFWYSFDKETGLASTFVKDISEQLNSTKDRIIEFRKNR